MKRSVLTLLLLAAMPAAADDYALGPDSQPQAGVPKGTVTRYTLDPGKLFPGTPHNYAVYVPAQYNPSKPTAFMIYLDGLGAIGNGMRVPVVFDNLIAKHEIPIMIGIFVDPGVLPATSSQAQSRFERVFEIGLAKRSLLPVSSRRVDPRSRQEVQPFQGSKRSRTVRKQYRGRRRLCRRMESA